MKTRFFAFAALALTLAACNNDNENLNDGPVAAQFIADITPATRVNSEGTDWTDGDRIGVTGAGFTNVPYKRENGKFVTDGTTIYFNDTETHTFHAYYPYQSDGGTVTVSTAADKQGTGIDFLFASGATGNTHNPTVSFTGDHTFHHCMSLIKFTFKAGDGLSFNETEPAGYTLEGAEARRHIRHGYRNNCCNRSRRIADYHAAGRCHHFASHHSPTGSELLS